jgi:hypothetical protein
MEETTQGMLLALDWRMDETLCVLRKRGIPFPGWALLRRDVTPGWVLLNALNLSRPVIFSEDARLLSPVEERVKRPPFVLVPRVDGISSCHCQNRLIEPTEI